MASDTSAGATILPDQTVRITVREERDLAAKLRRAYGWIVNKAIICPYFDIQFGATSSVPAGAGASVELRDGTSFSSCVLLPLLTLLTSRRLLFVGAPGRGKTTVAVLMGLLAGHTMDEMKRAVQHGHPQLTVSDLLGSPRPGEILQARHRQTIPVDWRPWITMRVKIIDEYNRIPTRTQAALLSLMAEGYAEMHEQVVESGPSAWFLTANDSMGGGTEETIEALKDRIDIVVRSTPFHPAFLPQLVARVERSQWHGEQPPTDIILSHDELSRAASEISTIPVPDTFIELLGFFLGQLDFCTLASDTLEHKNKDTLHLAGKSVSEVCSERCPMFKADRNILCAHTENGVSARTYMSIIHYAKALAWFRGRGSVSEEDLRQLVPWILHDKLKPNVTSPAFPSSGAGTIHVHLLDRVAWIRTMFDRAKATLPSGFPHSRILEMMKEQEERMEELTDKDVCAKLEEARMLMGGLAGSYTASTHQDLVLLRRIWSRYRNRLHYLRGAAADRE